MTTLFISHSSKDKEWAEQTREALLSQGYQSLFLDSHPDHGIHAGAEWEQTLWQKLRQSRGIVVLCTTHWLASPWCVAEAMIARERGKPLFMVLSADVGDAQIPDFLKDRQSISLAKMTEQGYGLLLWYFSQDTVLIRALPAAQRRVAALEATSESLQRALPDGGVTGRFVQNCTLSRPRQERGAKIA